VVVDLASRRLLVEKRSGDRQGYNTEHPNRFPAWVSGRHGYESSLTVASVGRWGAKNDLT
jgi:hypothetical protein